jgi:hypothetical protein
MGSALDLQQVQGNRFHEPVQVPHPARTGAFRSVAMAYSSGHGNSFLPYQFYSPEETDSI